MLVALISFAGCDFVTSATKQPIKPAKVDAGNGSQASGGTTAPATDGGNLAIDGSLDASSVDDAGDGGGVGDGDGGSVKPPQNGGLKCGDVFCPFADAPIVPCCTTDADVKGVLATATNRCGLSFAETGSDFFGEGCWQRDQPGLVDKTCPGVQVDLKSKDPGCCTSQGTCGGIDTEHGLGCHADPSAKAQACGEKPNPDGDACDARGIYALRMEVDLTWGGRDGGLWDLTDDGRGKLVLNLKVRFDEVADETNELTGKIEVCGVELPAFYSSTLCEAYQPTFPTTMWESEAMPRFDLDGHLQCRKPGCIASIDAQTVLLGISLDNPEAPWPTADDTADLECEAGEGEECFPDQDDDDLPGLTLPITTEGTSTAGRACNQRYSNNGAPLSSSAAAIFGGVRRADRVLLGVRMKVGASFKLGENCESGAGSGIAEFVNSRGVGCVVERGTYTYPNGRRAGENERCTADEASFMDSNLPLYTILGVGEEPASNLELPDDSASLGPEVSIVRLGDLDADVSCADIRAAAMPMPMPMPMPPRP